MKAPLHEIVYEKDFLQSRHCLLAGDIGGTNSNFGIFEIRGMTPTLLISLHTKSQEVTDYAQLVEKIVAHVKQKYQIVITRACIGVAGIIGQGHTAAKPTNLSVEVDAPQIMKTAGLERVILINDFEAVGLGIEAINQRDLVLINKGSAFHYGQKACIGAGTGFGKVALLWNEHFKRYIPVASEGGHADCSVQSEIEFSLLEFVKAERGTSCPISWEDVLSGNGIKLMYRFLALHKDYPVTSVGKEIEATGFKPDLISCYASKDARCADTFNLYTVLYARCAKNFVLDTLALAGIYIAGGIAAKNIGLFKQPQFMEEFTSCGKHSKILQNVPVFVVADYNVSLYGAVVFMQLHEQGIL